MRAVKPAILPVVLIAFLAAGCESIQEVLNLQKPGAQMTGLKFVDVKLDSATLLFDVEVENPYPVVLPLLSMGYGLSSGANRFLSGSADLQTTVPAKSTKAVSLPASINYLQMLKALGGIRPGVQIPYQAKLTLAVDTPGLGRITLPLKKDGQIVLPTISDVDVKDIWNMIKSN
ncbi:MAG: LEA type 2 family protein [Phycisphaerales bacterium]|nr:MAG: LEA type 2 family protein [Phycisphaerales bacterium]